MLSLAIRLVMAGFLLASSIAKVASPRTSSEALATYGITGPRAQRAAWAALIVIEVALAVGVAAGWSLAAYLAAGLMATFAAALAFALRDGREGAPCACFGGRSRVSRSAVGRNCLLAAAFLVVAILP